MQRTNEMTMGWILIHVLSMIFLAKSPHQLGMTKIMIIPILFELRP